MMTAAYHFVDYDPLLHRELDSWRGGEIARFAMDNPISEEWGYYLESGEYRAGTDTFCKVAVLNDRPLAAMIIFCRPDAPVVINPIIVAPELTGFGHGSAVLRAFTEHIGNILPGHSGCVEVVIDNENIASIRAFSKAGFFFAREHPDGDAVIYKKHLT